jgi:hypothetical protein
LYPAFRRTVVEALQRFAIVELIYTISDWLLPRPAIWKHWCSQPRRSASITLRVGGRHHLGHHSFTVEAIEGDVVTVRFGPGAEAVLNVPPILLA